MREATTRKLLEWYRLTLFVGPIDTDLVYNTCANRACFGKKTLGSKNGTCISYDTSNGHHFLFPYTLNTSITEKLATVIKPDPDEVLPHWHFRSQLCFIWILSSAIPTLWLKLALKNLHNKFYCILGKFAKCFRTT